MNRPFAQAQSLIPLSSRKIHQKNILREMIIITGIFFLTNGLLFGTPAVAKVVYKNRVMPYVRVGNTLVGGQTPDQAYQALLQNPEEIKRPVTIRYADQLKRATFSELGTQEDVQSEIAQAVTIGRSRPFMTNLRVQKRFRINQAKLEQTVVRLFGQVEGQPKNAALSIDNGQIVIQPSTNGQLYDWPSIKNQFLANIDRENPMIDLNLTVQRPAVVEADLEAGHDQLIRMIDKKITIVVDGQAMTVPKGTVGQWLQVNQKNIPVNISVNQEKIREFVDQLTKRHNRQSKSEIRFDDGTVDQVGINGRAIKTDGLVASLTKSLDLDQSEINILVEFDEIPFDHKIRARGYTAGLTDGKYIEVNLTDQNMYLFEGNNLTGTYRVSTGKWSMPTPEGAFAINNKVDVAYSATYKLYMPHWLAFVGSKYGIHGLPYWASGYVEGENHLGRPVSHGCIRLSQADAETVYNWAEIGTKVYIHK